ncbi:hypothetical protein JNW88_29435 [Micromonospora sp. ATA32]|nr:hypothetical protein [Micromonospora sp. ATA32]
MGEIRAGLAAGLSAAAEGERRVYRLAACLADELVGLGTLRYAILANDPRPAVGGPAGR